MEIIKFVKSFIISIILAIVCNVNNEILVTFGQFVPAPRYAASSEIIGDKLYVFGGQVANRETYNTSLPSREVIYLDLSKSFGSSSPPWVDYSNISPLPVLNSWAASCKDKYNKTIYIFGGAIEDANTNNDIIDNNKQIYIFDTTKNTWTTPVVTGALPPTRRREMKVVMDDLGKMYVFGGTFDSVIGGPKNSIWFNDTKIFDSNLLTWTQTTPTNLPTSRTDFTATYLPKNKLIIYIGGLELRADGLSYSVNINQILTFDTVSLTWSTKTAGGTIVDNRRGHSAVLTSDYRIICYGGKTYDDTTPRPSLLVLDVSTDNYQWSTPVTTTSNQPPNLVFHVAELYQDTMIVAFGNMTQSGGMLNKQLFLLDTKSYTWVTNFQGNSSTLTTTSPSYNSGMPSSTDANPIIIAVSIVGSLVVIILIIAITILILRHRKKNQKNQKDKNYQDYQNPNNLNFQNGPNYQNNLNFQSDPNYQNNLNFQSDPNYQNNLNLQSGPNYQNNLNFQSGPNYQSNQDIIEIPSSTDHNELRYSYRH